MERTLLTRRRLTTSSCQGRNPRRSIAGVVYGVGLARPARKSIPNIRRLDAKRTEEPSGKLKAGIGNGLTKTGIQELLFQVSIYMGMPTGLGSFRVATKTLEENGILR
jgi:hypothetical protein